MDQIRANTPAPIKANLMTEQLSVQMSWGNGGCTRAGSPGDQQSRELGPWAARRSRAMLRANAWGHDELTERRTSSANHLFTMHTVAHADHRVAIPILHVKYCTQFLLWVGWGGTSYWVYVTLSCHNWKHNDFRYSGAYFIY